MRALVLAPLLAAVSPVLAQSQFAPEAGAFVSVSDADLLRGGDGEVALDAEVGWRFGNGLDASVGVGLGHTSFRDVVDPDAVGSQTRLGGTVRVSYARGLGSRLGLRLGVEGGLEQADNDRAPAGQYVRGRWVNETNASDAFNLGFAGFSAATYTRLPLSETVALQPSVGLFTRGVISTTTTGAFSLRADTGTSRADGEFGPEVALPVTVHAFGTAFAVDPAVRFDIGRSSGQPSRLDATLRLRVNV